MRFCLTIDVEWAPEFVIEWMAERVKDAKISATWFATHDSKALKKLACDSSQEIGLHPNFFPGSTQGLGMEDVMVRLTRLYPNARGVRSHAFLDSTRHHLHYSKLGLKYISNTIVWTESSKPFFLPWSSMWQIPISWEDDVACNFAKDISLDFLRKGKDAIWVLNFHPLYCYLNEKIAMPVYSKLKSDGVNITGLSRDILSPLRYKGRGLLNMFDFVLSQACAHKFVTMGSVCNDLEKNALKPKHHQPKKEIR